MGLDADLHPVDCLNRIYTKSKHCLYTFFFCSSVTVSCWKAYYYYYYSNYYFLIESVLHCLESIGCSVRLNTSPYACIFHREKIVFNYFDLTLDKSIWKRACLSVHVCMCVSWVHLAVMSHTLTQTHCLCRPEVSLQGHLGDLFRIRGFSPITGLISFFSRPLSFSRLCFPKTFPANFLKPTSSYTLFAILDLISPIKCVTFTVSLQLTANYAMSQREERLCALLLFEHKSWLDIVILHSRGENSWRQQKDFKSL